MSKYMSETFRVRVALVNLACFECNLILNLNKRTGKSLFSNSFCVILC